MKRLILPFLLVASSSILNAKSCSEEQIGNMIKQNLSQSTIDSICKDDEKKSNDKQVIVNVTNAPVNNNTNTNTNTNNVGANQLNNNKNEIEYFFWRIGGGKYTRGEFSEDSYNLGIHYYVNGFTEDGFGFGLEVMVSGRDDLTYTRIESLNEYQLLYNFHLNNGFIVTPAYITGTRHYEFVPKNSSIYGPFSTIGDEKIEGFGLYLTLPGVVKSGQGLSIFYKSLKDQHESISNVGIQFIW